MYHIKRMEVPVKSSCKRQVIAALLANIPGLTYGIQIGWLSPMAPILKSEQSPAPAPLSDDVITWMVTALPLAALASLPLVTYCLDSFGRKYSIIMLSTFSSLTWALKLFVINPYGLVCARVFAGVASSGCFLVVPVYLKEISEDSLRGALGSLLMSFCNAGVILVYILGMTLSYYQNQWIYLSISILHVVLFFFMPESPAFLVKMEKDKEAAKTIAWLRTVGKHDKCVQEEIHKLKEAEIMYREAPKVTLRNIWQEKIVLRPLVICLILIGVEALSGCFAIVNFASSIFQRAGSVWSPNLLALFVGALQFSGSLLATVTVEKFGRKLLLIASCLVISMCMAAVATSFLMGWLAWWYPHWLPALAVCLCIFSFGAGLGPVPYVLMAEVFSFHLRARLLGVIMAFSWANCTFTVLIFAPIANTFGEHAIFYAFAAITLFGAMFTAFCVPETKGRTLEEIQGKFLGKKVRLDTETWSN